MSRLLSRHQAFLLVLAALSPALLPTSARAQFALAPGTYQLANGAQGTASLKFVPAEADHPTLLTGVRNGQERSFRCAEVAAFTVDNHKFSRQDGFRLRAGYDAQHPGPVLLELVETGPVELFYYHYVAEMGASLKAHVRLPVLRKQGTQTFFVYSPQRTPGLPPGQGIGTFAAALFSADPVLQRRFATNVVTRADIADLVRAYNSGVRLKL
jgi:hypothetical protein